MNPYRVTLAVVLLGLFCTFWISDALAQLHDWNGSRTSPGSIYRRGPNGLPFNVDTGRYVGIDSAPGGGASLKGRYGGSLAGRGLAIESAQLVPGSALARIGKGLARSVGPVGLGLTLAPLIWDEIQNDWLTEEEQLPGEAYWLAGIEGGAPWKEGATASAACQAQWPHAVGAKFAVGDPVKTSGACYWYPDGGLIQILGQALKTCRTGTLDGTGQCVVSVPSRPATDQQLEDAIYVELVSRGMGSDLARRLIQAGYEPSVIGDAGSIELSGPSSVQGGTISSTTTGPAGTTITNTTTNYDITYQGDTVTVTQNTTTTTTRPDGSTETTTETKTPAPGTDAPTPNETEQTPFCELYPDASACQPLGSAGDQELNAETRTVELDYTGAAGSCPAPHMMNLQGKSVSFSYDPLCDFARGIRPLVIALSMLFAGLFLLSVGRSQ